jgi:hypothetical protein
MGQMCKSARYLCFADTGRSNHQNVFGYDFVAQFLAEQPSSVSVAQCNSDSALSGVLADNVSIKFGDDLPRG